MFGGSKSSMPYLKIVCVCPPQTSIKLSGGSPIRAESRTISPASRLAISPLRYSSRYFISHFLHYSVNYLLTRAAPRRCPNVECFDLSATNDAPGVREPDPTSRDRASPASPARDGRWRDRK